MKKILFLLLTVVTVCSCYNDDDLWDKVNDLDGRDRNTRNNSQENEL